MECCMFRKMEYVYEIYTEKSFTKAAEKLYISQPCLSAAIKKIEDEIGMPLFERRHSTLVLTEVGEKYLKAAEQIRCITKDFLSEVNDMHNLVSGSLHIGVPNYIMSYIIPEIVNEYTKLYPGIQITLHEANSVSLWEMLNNEQVDIVVDSFDEEGSRYDYWPLTEEEIYLAVPAHSPSAQDLEDYRITPEEFYTNAVKSENVRAVSLEHFRDEKFILLKNGNSMYKHALQAFEGCGFEPKISFRLDQLSTSYAMTASGNGVCFVTDTMFRYHRFTDNVYLYKIRGTGKRKLCIVKKKSRYGTVALLRFAELFQKSI